jgi:hypothetical protein
MPSHIDIDFIEKELATSGELAFIKHPKYGFQITYCIGEELNMYGRPNKYLCFTPNNVINEYFEAEDIVIIRNNKLSQTSYDFINRYASILAEIQKAKEVNLNAQKTPILIQCDESQRLTMQNIYSQYEGNWPVIFAKKGFDMEGITVLKTEAPYLLDKFQAEKIDNLNECLNFLGIKTVADKKERMIQDEVNANNDLTNICLAMFLNTRLEAVDKINEKWGAELQKDYNGLIEIQLAEYVKSELQPHIKEVKTNE